MAELFNPKNIIVMAKSKSFFGLRTGSTKSLTFQVYRGQQITKDRVTRISSPRSEAQMKQRALIPIVAASRAALKGLVDHSFEGVAYGEQSLKKFSELNLRAGTLTVESYSPNGYSNPGFADLIVSKGTLGVFPSEKCYNTENGDRTSQIFHIPAAGKNELKFTAAEKDNDADAILNTMAAWGKTDCEWVAPGNQLTFLTVSNVGTVYVGKNEASLSTFDINRLLFPSAETTPLQLIDVNGSYKLVNNVTEGASKVELYNSTVTMVINYNKVSKELTIEVQPTNNGSGSTCEGGALIRSAYLNGTWKRSSTTISYPKDVDPQYTYEMWRSYYQSTGTSAKYLNQGNEGTGIA